MMKAGNLPFVAAAAAAMLLAACDGTPVSPESDAIDARLAAVSAEGADRVLSESLYDLEGVILVLECPDGSFSDEVELEGAVYERYMVVRDAAGGFHARLQSMPVGLRGRGLVSGESYRVQEREQITVVQRDGLVGSYRQVLRMFSMDSHRSFSLVASGNYNEDADGNVIVQRDDLRITCR